MRSIGPLNFDNEREKRRVRESKTSIVKIPSQARAHEIMYLLIPTLSELGIQCSVYNDNPGSMSYINPALDHQMLIFRVDKLSDDLYYRSQLSADDNRIRKENEENEKIISELRSENERLQKELDSIKSIVLTEKKKARDEYKARKKKLEEKEKEDAEPSYKEKVKWFCQKYREDYSIMFESLKDDDLDKLHWKGEKVNFPKTRKELMEEMKNEKG